MNNLGMQRRLASEILKVGKSRVVFNPEMTSEISEAITREDVKLLIIKGAINSKPKKGVSKGRSRELHEQQKKGRRKGLGTRKGTAKSRNPKKRAWINKIRAQRKLLKDLKEHDKIELKVYRKLYRLAKAGFFRSNRHLKLYLSKMGGEK